MLQEVVAMPRPQHRQVINQSLLQRATLHPRASGNVDETALNYPNSRSRSAHIPNPNYITVQQTVWERRNHNRNVNFVFPSQRVIRKITRNSTAVTINPVIRPKVTDRQLNLLRILHQYIRKFSDDPDWNKADNIEKIVHLLRDLSSELLQSGKDKILESAVRQNIYA